MGRRWVVRGELRHRPDLRRVTVFVDDLRLSGLDVASGSFLVIPFGLSVGVNAMGFGYVEILVSVGDTSLVAF